MSDYMYAKNIGVVNNLDEWRSLVRIARNLHIPPDLIKKKRVTAGAVGCPVYISDDAQAADGVPKSVFEMSANIWPPIPQYDDPYEGDTEDLAPDIPDPPKCPDCKGTGKYVGLNEVEDCDTCLGSGY